MTQYISGFAIGDDGRAIIEDLDPVYFWEGLPFTKNNTDAGEQTGPIAFVSVKSAFDAKGEIVYQDVAVTPYSGPVGVSGGLPHKPDGTLLCDSAGAIANYYNGLPFTAAGFLCIKADKPPVPVPPGVPVPQWATPTDTSINVQFKEVAGTKPLTYWAEVKPTGGTAVQQELDVSYASTDVFTKVLGLSPGTEYTVSIYATNTAGTSAKSTAYKFSTTDSTRPDAPILNAVYPAKTSILLDYTYPQTARLYLEPKFYNAYASDGTKTTKAEVYDPDQDMVVAGLTEGVKYDCWVTAVSAEGKEGPKSNVMSTTCKSVIPAPTLLTAVPGDGKVDLTWTAVTPGGSYTVDHYSFSAKNITNPDEPNIEGHIVGTTSGSIALANDTTWEISICAVCNPGLIPGDFSNALQATPFKPSVPYRPVITTCYAQPNGQLVIEWAKGTNGNNRNASAMDVTSWQLNVLTGDGKGNSQIIDIPDPNTTKYLTDKVTIGWWEIIVYANNDQGRSDGSVPVSVQYNPTKDDPILGGTRFDDGTYKYAIFNSGATTGYEALRTETGKDIDFEVLLAGAGGAGKGQTLVGGKGGDGGGGQLVITTLPATGVTGSIFVKVPNGGNSKLGTSPENTTIKEGDTILEAVAGKTATDKNNAQGYPKQQVTGGWQNLNMFSFLRPGSEYVGGVAVAGEQNFPAATYCGEGGAGTKDSNPGAGGQSFVAIRWKK